MTTCGCFATERGAAEVAKLPSGSRDGHVRDYDLARGVFAADGRYGLLALRCAVGYGALFPRATSLRARCALVRAKGALANRPRRPSIRADHLY